MTPPIDARRKRFMLLASCALASGVAPVSCSDSSPRTSGFFPGPSDASAYEAAPGIGLSGNPYDASQTDDAGADANDDAMISDASDDADAIAR